MSTCVHDNSERNPKRSQELRGQVGRDIEGLAMPLHEPDQWFCFVYESSDFACALPGTAQRLKLGSKGLRCLVELLVGR